MNNFERCELKVDKSNSLKVVIGKLEDLFSKFNGKFFKNELETPVITVSPDTTKGAYGWCITKLNNEALEFIKSLNEQSFNLYRSKIPKIMISSSSSSRKYACPRCGTIIIATKEVRVICSDCDIEFEEEI